ncbi:MAG: inositol monophosphatase [Helicobacteraceae bacterium]|jgi:myo-inositol-1(or 4)-monophosphatase|nr:inositol monophosphatase [Helicobacteraceae bacterium]
MESFIEAAIEANQTIAALLRDNKDDALFYPAKEGDDGIGYGGDRSLRIDLIAEDIFIERLSRFGRVNSEERGPFGEGEDEIVIDPIDGSANIASGIPYYGSAVALKRNGKPICSVTCNLANDECFIKSPSDRYRRGLFSAEKKPISRALRPLAGIFEKAYSHPKSVAAMRKNGLKFRSPGALALSLAYARDARFALAMGRSREYDIIGGLHLCDDLHIFTSEKLIIVSADFVVFERLKSIFIEDESEH